MKTPFIFFNSFLVSKRTTIYGDVLSDTNGRVAGLINGNVKTTGNLIIKKQGIVNGDVQANNVWIKGKVKGNVHCEGKVFADKNAEVLGHIFAREAIIDKESNIKGGIAQLHKAREENEFARPAEEAMKNSLAVIENKPEADDKVQNWF